MTEPPPRPRRPRPAPTFRPEFTLLVVYFFAFFVFFALLLALPELLDALRTLPAGATPDEARAAGAAVARRALSGRLLWALFAAFLALGAAAWARVLPGLRDVRRR